jgi:hypothetical protein
MSEPDMFPPEPSRLFLIGLGFDPKFTKVEPYIGAGYEYDYQDRIRTWRANRFVPTPGMIGWQQDYPGPNPTYTMSQSGQQPERYGAFMVHGHYSYIHEVTDDNPYYPKSTYSVGGGPFFNLHFITTGEGETATTNGYLQAVAYIVGSHSPPNMDDAYGRDVLPAALEGAIVTIYADGTTRDIGLESSAYVWSQGGLGQDAGDYTGLDTNKCFVQKITSRDGDVISLETEWSDIYGNPL